MKGIIVLSAGILIFSVIGYFGLSAVNEYIDSESGAVVEQALLDNTINQLMIFSEIEFQIEEGNIEKAKEKLAEAISTLKYILNNNCNLAKCQEALSNYEKK